MLLPESTHALAVGILLVLLFISFVREWVKPDVAVLTAVALLLVSGLLTPAKVLGVFSNSAPFTIACLFIISGALSRTGCVDWLGERIAQAAGENIFNPEERKAAVDAKRQELVSQFSTQGNMNSPNSTAPAVGDIIDGYKFKGGDPKSPESWEAQ